MYILVETLQATGQMRVVCLTDSKQEVKKRKKSMKNPSYYAEINQEMDKELTYFLLMSGLSKEQIRPCLLFVHQLLEKYNIYV